MASILAIVSRKVFERDFRVGGTTASLGDVVATSAYASSHVSLDKLKAGGDLFLVTVAPGEQLWLAGVLAAPSFDTDRWEAASNATPITDITSLVTKLQFENGKGLTAKAGALAMSLQTPRTLAEGDVALLRAAAGITGRGKPAKATTPVEKPAKRAAKQEKPIEKPAKRAAKQETPVEKPAKRAAKQEKPVEKAAGFAAKSKPSTKSGAKVSTASGVFPTGASPDDPLAAAGRNLAANSYAMALEDLLRAWERCKAAEIGALIDELGGWLATGLPAIEGKRTAIDAAWRDIGEQCRAIDVPRLVAAFELGSSGQIEGWLDTLDLFPLDPRMCAPAIDISMKFVASSAGPTRTRAFRIAEKIRDGRCIAQIEKLIKKDMNAWNTKDLKDRLRKMRAKFADPPALPAADKATVAALAKQVAKLVEQPPPDEKALGTTSKAAAGDSARLLAEVLAAPDDDAPRMVYADALQEEGDPRGELITLQLQRELTPAQRDRVDVLVKDKRNLGKWLGPLAPVVSEPRFARGFLDACTVTLKTAKHKTELVRDPLWGTVRSMQTANIEIVESPATVSLREVSGLTVPQVVTLARRSKPLPIRRLSGLMFNGYVDDPIDQQNQGLPLWKEIGRIGALRDLRSLSFEVSWESENAVGVTPAGFDWLVESRLLRQLEELSIWFVNPTPRLVDWLPLFEVNDKLQRLGLGTIGRNYGTLSTDVAAIAIRDGGKLRIELELARIFQERKDRPLRWEFDRVPKLLDGFPVANAPALHAVVTSRCTNAQLETLQAHLESKVGKRFSSISTATR